MATKVKYNYKIKYNNDVLSKIQYYYNDELKSFADISFEFKNHKKYLILDNSEDPLKFELNDYGYITVIYNKQDNNNYTEFRKINYNDNDQITKVYNVINEENFVTIDYNEDNTTNKIAHNTKMTYTYIYDKNSLENKTGQYWMKNLLESYFNNDYITTLFMLGYFGKSSAFFPVKYLADEYSYPYEYFKLNDDGTINEEQSYLNTYYIYY
ncbi:MAG: hypothetical protein MJ211_03355 [Bacteroidales bacterium]|nr:hypothetical protein [Bacteroidales bacterium]